MRKSCFLFIIAAALISGNVSAFDNEVTHPDLTDRAIRSSKLSDYLKDTLNLPKGAETIVEDLTLEEWIERGSTLEDEPPCRASNHFHNPLEPWTESYMSDQPWFINLWCSGGEYPPGNIKSDVHWATGYTAPAPDGTKVDTGNQWDWDHAREYYYSYLTGKDFQGNPVATTKDQRQKYFSKCFQSLGQVLHLIQDMAVPAHVRNDFRSHLDWVGITPGTLFHPTKWFGDKFEYFVAKHDEWITGSSGGDLADPTLTRFWDTDNYNGQTPSISLSSPLIGLTEYTNINFASKNTIFAEDFLIDYDSSNDVYYHPYPRKSSTDMDVILSGNKPPETIIDEDGKADLRVYVAKTGDGAQVARFVTATYFTNEIKAVPDYDVAIFYRSLEIDKECAKDYASKLLPRAIGYSAGMLDYFFRGEIDMVPDDEMGFGYVIVNKTEEDMAGTFELYYDNSSDQSIQCWTGDFTLGTMSSGNNESSNIDFTAPDDAKEPGKYMLVFKGKLGNESETVVGKVLVLGILETVYVTMTVGATQRCFAWDAEKNGYASINNNEGNPVSFPCDPADISNWENKQINAGATLFSSISCGQGSLVDWSTCPDLDWNKAGSGGGSAKEPSVCGCDLVDVSSWTCGGNYTTLCYKKPNPPPRNWSAMYGGDGWLDKQDHISAFGNSKKLTFLNGSGSIGVCREERQFNISKRIHTAYGVCCGGNDDCDNFIMYWNNESGTAKYYLPFADEVFSQVYSKHRSWDYCRDLGQTTNVDVPAPEPFKINGSFTDKIMVQIYAFEMLTGSVSIGCAMFDWGEWCLGPDCEGDHYRCPSENNEIDVFHGLKLTAQVGVFPEGTNGVNPMSLSRNSSFESAISGMYDVLRVVESVPNDEKANVTITLFILKAK